MWDLSKNASYKAIKPYVRNQVTKHLTPSSGTRFDVDKIIIFELKTGPEEFARIPELPFLAVYRLLHNGEDPYKTLSLAAKANTSADDEKKMVYINNALGFSSFFTHYEATLNDFNINSESNLGQLQYIYQCLNRFFATSTELKAMFGGDMAEIIDFDGDRQFPNPTSKLMHNMTSSSFPVPEMYKTTAFAFDGGSLLGPRNFAYAALRGKSIVNAQKMLIPPNSTLLIKLFRVEDHGQRLEYPTNQHNYFTNNPATFNIKAQKTTLDLKKLTFKYDSFIISQPELLNKINKSDLHFYTDNINYMQFSIPTNQAYTDWTVKINRKTRCLYIVFCKSYQLYSFQQDNKNQCGRFMFPKHLQKIECEFPGNEKFGFVNGFTNLGHMSFFPELAWGEKHFSFRQALFLDLTQKKIPEDTTMKLSCEWGEADAIQGETVPDRDMNVLVFTVQEADLMREKKTGKYSIRII